MGDKMKRVTIKVQVSPELRAVIQKAAAQDEQAEGAWLRIVAVAMLRKRKMWPVEQ